MFINEVLLTPFFKRFWKVTFYSPHWLTYSDTMERKKDQEEREKNKKNPNYVAGINLTLLAWTLQKLGISMK